MAKEQVTYQEPDDLEPVESPSTELATMMMEGDPDSMLHIMERKAKLAPRMNRAINAILVACTYPEDWIEHGDKMCLASAAAERVARNFDIRFANVAHKKEEFRDELGAGYRYIFEGEASMGNRVYYVTGAYGTRDNFLGKKGGEWKPLEDINENQIRTAAFHIFIGNGIKALLGLRGIPKTRFDEMMAAQGEDSTKAGKASYGTGTKGGSSADDHAMQKELGELLVEIANAGYEIKVEGDGTYSLETMSELADPMEVAKSSCKNLTTFKGKGNKLVAGIDSVKMLKGKRLEIALRNAKDVWKGGEGANDAD